MHGERRNPGYKATCFLVTEMKLYVFMCCKFKKGIYFCRLLKMWILIGPQREKTCLRGFANNTGADQPAHPRRLISAYVIRLSKCILSRLATSEISIFYVVFVAEETDLKLVLAETPNTGFLATWPN